MTEHIQRFAHSRTGVQLNLAKILLHLERPRKALDTLKSIALHALDETTGHTHGKLVAAARKMIDDGVMELSE